MVNQKILNKTVLLRRSHECFFRWNWLLKLGRLGRQWRSLHFGAMPRYFGWSDLDLGRGFGCFRSSSFGSSLGWWRWSWGWWSMLLVPIALRLWSPRSGQAGTQRLLPAQWVNPSSKNTLKAQYFRITGTSTKYIKKSVQKNKSTNSSKMRNGAAQLLYVAAIQSCNALPGVIFLGVHVDNNPTHKYKTNNSKQKVFIKTKVHRHAKSTHQQNNNQVSLFQLMKAVTYIGE